MVRPTGLLAARRTNQRHVVVPVGDMLRPNARAKAGADATGGRLAAAPGNSAVGLDRRDARPATQPAAVMASVDEASVGIGGGPPRPFFLQHALPRAGFSRAVAAMFSAPRAVGARSVTGWENLYEEGCDRGASRTVLRSA